MIAEDAISLFILYLMTRIPSLMSMNADVLDVGRVCTPIACRPVCLEPSYAACQSQHWQEHMASDVRSHAILHRASKRALDIWKM